MTPHSAGPVWLQGPVEGVPPLLQPVAHALLEADHDVQLLLADLTVEQASLRPHGAASVAFHLRHALGSLDRLLTYAQGKALSEAQLARLAAEKTPEAAAGNPGPLAADFTAAVQRALEQLRATPAEALLAPRAVGRARLPSDVLGLLAHAAHHTYRHVGQAITTAKIARSMLGA